MSLLEVKQISTGYGIKQVLFDVDLKVEKNETVLLIGSNGSGKSSLFKAIYGVLPIWKGSGLGKVIFNGYEITNEKSHKLISQGLMYVPQKDELFEDMTVKQNLEISLLHLNNRKETIKGIEEVFGKINILAEYRNRRVGKLSGGERKLLSLGMVLTNRPKLVLYDEPFAGLSGDNISMVLKWLQTLKENGTTIVIIEHRIKELISFADKIVGLKFGQRNTEALDNIERIKSFML